MASLHKANLWNLTLTAVTYLDSDCLSNLNEIDGTQKKKIHWILREVETCFLSSYAISFWHNTKV